MSEKPPSSPKPKPRVRSKRRRWLMRVLIILICMPVLVLIIGQTPLMQRIVEPILGSKLGVDVHTGSVKLMPNGRIIIRDAVFSSGTLDHRGGNLIEIDRASIDMNWIGVLKGSGQVRSVLIDHPLVRLSQNSEDGRLNLAAIKLASDGGGGPTPAIEIRNGLLQIGEHDQQTYTMLKELALQGWIKEQDDDGNSVFELVIRPTDTSMSDGSIINRPAGVIGLSGTIGPDGVDGTLDGLRLEDWPAAYIPSRSRGIYERLALSGVLAPTRFSINTDGEMEVVLTLDGVALNLPIDDTGSLTGQGDLLRMRRTRGTIAFGTRGLLAELNGLIDELEYDVTLSYDGLESSSPFDAVLTTEFRLDDQFKPARFLPEKVISKLDRFDHPIADVAARVQIQRNAGEDIRVSGEATLSNGSAIYKKFRYPFTQLSGSVSFDPDKLVVSEISGVGPSGARLQVDGLFSPLGEDSVVTLNLRVEGVPIDEYLIRALDDDQRELVAALFSREDYEQLLSDEQLLNQEDRAELGDLRRSLWDRLDQWEDGVDGDQSMRDQLAAELSRIDRKLRIPDFSFGGKSDVDVVLRRHPERPSDNRWTTDIRVSLDEGGLVPGHFPLPIVAHSVEISISDDRVELTGGQYTGLAGGTAEVSAIIDRTQKDAKPVVTIKAMDIPIDQRLVAAIPGYHAPQSEDPDEISLRRILDRLRLGGKVECDAQIGPRSDGRLGYDVEATITNGSARPVYHAIGVEPGEAIDVPIGTDPLSLGDLYGTIYVTEELIIVDLDGSLSSPELPLPPTPIQVLTQLTLPSKQRGMGGVRRQDGLLPTDFGPPVPGPELYATARADGLDLAMPLEHAVAVVSPKIARQLVSYEHRYSPDGVLAIDTKLEGFVGGGVESSFTLDRIEHLSFTHESSRYELGASWGRAGLTLTHAPELSFDGFRIPLRVDGDDAGTLWLDGKMPLTRAGQLYELDDPESLQISYEQGRLGSTLTSALVDRIDSGSGGGWFHDHQVDGRFDLDVTLTPRRGVYRIPRSAASFGLFPMKIDGQLLPRSLSLRMDDRVASFDTVRGAVRFEGLEGRFEEIHASDGGTSLDLDGTWAMRETGGTDIDLDLDASGDLLSGPVRALLPKPIDRVIDGLEIESSQGVQIEGMKIRAWALGTDASRYRIEGKAGIEQGRALIGLPLTGISGELGFTVQGEQDTLGYELNLDASRLRAGLIRVYDTQVQIIGDANNQGVVLIPEIIAGMHGGRIAGSAQIRPGSDGTPNYWMDLHASGVRFAPVFDDLLLPPEGLEGPPLPGNESVLSSWSKAEDLSRGAMLGDLTLTGPIGDPEKRTGRGTMQIAGGSVLALPGLINLIEASNLSLPTGATIDLAQADFYIDGQTLAFEQLSASSRKIEILGYGTLSWESRALDLRFRSRAIKPIPIVSGLFESLRDELITTRVTGTLSDPVYSASQFSQTRRLVQALLGNPPSDQQRRLEQVQRRVLSEQDRARRSTSDSIHMPSDRTDDGWDWGSGSRPADRADPEPERPS